MCHFQYHATQTTFDNHIMEIFSYDKEMPMRSEAIAYMANNSSVDLRLDSNFIFLNTDLLWHKPCGMKDALLQFV